MNPHAGRSGTGNRGSHLEQDTPGDCLISSERIRLRKLRETDADGNYYHWMNNPEVTKFLQNSVQQHSREALKAYIRQTNADSAYLFLAILLKTGNHHIGNIKLGPISQLHKHGDIGIIIGEQAYWGKGYATEAIALLVKYAFHTLKLHKLTAGCTALNKGSLKAFQRNGFEIEGVKKKQFFWRGDYIDGIFFGLINEDSSGT